MPRSPIFLITKGKTDEARKSLQFLRGKNANIERELEQIQEDVNKSQNIGNIGPMKLFTTKEYAKPIMISMVLMFLQQLSRVLFIYSYLALIFEVCHHILILYILIFNLEFWQLDRHLPEHNSCRCSSDCCKYHTNTNCGEIWKKTIAYHF